MVAEAVIRTFGLSKRYGTRPALSGLDLAVEPGRVFGFLGPNGAGKTTAISLLLGLLRPTAGRFELFGLDSAAQLAPALRRVGAIVENPAIYPHLSARDNLRIWGALSGGVTAARIDEVLAQVGLGGRKKDKAGKYSLGMKQRLGLAAALVHEPDLLVLDEPTNGLDPSGIREFRELFKGLARQGKTVFVSSHLLSEVQLMCDEVAIIKEGRLMAQGRVDDLLHRGTGIAMRVTDRAEALRVLSALPWVQGVAEDTDVISVEAPPERSAEISRALADAGVYLHELRPAESSLEDFFLEVTAEEQTGG